MTRLSRAASKILQVWFKQLISLQSDLAFYVGHVPWRLQAPAYDRKQLKSYDK
jgi:hypothetical protein